LIGAFLAMFVIVLATFLGAGVADFGANSADVASIGRPGGHQQRCGSANNRAIAIERDAANHHLDILFAQAFGGAMGAFIRAVVAGFDAVDISFVWHKFFPSLSVGKRSPRLAQDKRLIVRDFS
jgi:hypothetical protein